MFGIIKSKTAGMTIAALQILALFGLSEMGTLISKLIHLPMPGSIIGMVLLFILLKFRVVKLSWVDRGGDLLIREMLLFFVPSSVGIMTYGSLLIHFGLQILTTVVTSTALVMLCTGAIAEAISKNRQSNNAVRTELRA